MLELWLNRRGGRELALPLRSRKKTAEAIARVIGSGGPQMGLMKYQWSFEGKS